MYIILHQHSHKSIIQRGVSGCCIIYIHGSWTFVYGTLTGSVDGCDCSELGSKDTSGLGSGSVVVCNGLVVGWDDDSELDWGVCSIVDWVVVDG